MRARYHPPIFVDSRHLAALLLVGDLACAAPTRPCPPDTVADDTRARTLLALADATPAGHGVAAAKVCFGGAVRGTLRPDATIVLADWLDEPAAAARLIHLAMHVADGLHRFPAADVPCERQVEAALVAEARAIVAEITACDALACDPAPYVFAAEVLARAPDERAPAVLAKLHAAPETDGLDVLVRDYRTRCARGE